MLSARWKISAVAAFIEHFTSVSSSHVFATSSRRSLLGYTYDSIPRRWLIADEDEDEEVQDATQVFAVKDVGATSTRALSHNENLHEWLSYLAKLERVVRLDGVVPVSPEAKVSIMAGIVGMPFTNSGDVGEYTTSSEDVGGHITSSEDVGGHVTSSGDAGGNSQDVGDILQDVGDNSPAVDDCVGDMSTNFPSVDASGDEVASNTPTIGELVTSSVANTSEVSGSVINSDTAALELGGDVTNTIKKTQRPTRRLLNLTSTYVDNATQSLMIELNPASNPAGRPRESRQLRKPKRAKGSKKPRH
ncbi:hypothetical protein GQ600_27504 [Phytophthora cactorum]|nr:hypothetical protein GQ600_27504 [Phytophthora cactorum]